MTTSEKKKILRSNTISWMVAMVLPVFLHIAFASTKFPWPVLCPLLLIGFLLHTNNMLVKAIGETTEEPPSKP